MCQYEPVDEAKEAGDPGRPQQHTRSRQQRTQARTQPPLGGEVKTPHRRQEQRVQGIVPGEVRCAGQVQERGRNRQKQQHNEAVRMDP